MKKYTLNFGEFKQYDKLFLTADNGLDLESANSIAFSGESLYITQADCLLRYTDGKIKKLPIRASKLFSVDGKLYATIKNALVEIKNDKPSMVAEFDAPVVDISLALDGSLWLITENNLFLSQNGEFTQIVDLPEETVEKLEKLQQLQNELEKIATD